MTEPARPKSSIGCGTIGFLGLVGFCVLSMVIGALVSPKGATPTNATSRAAVPPAKVSPVKPLKVEIRNHYAESIFTLDVTVNSKKVDGGTAPIGKKVRVFEKERIRGHDELEKSAGFLMARDGDLRLNLAAMSLGEWRYFSAKIEPNPAAEMVVITYDWDFATAAFTITYGWR